MGMIDSYIHVYFRHRPDHIVSIKKGSAMPGVSGDTLPGISFEDIGRAGAAFAHIGPTGGQLTLRGPARV